MIVGIAGTTGTASVRSASEEPIGPAGIGSQARAGRFVPFPVLEF